jgi:superfamily I DNA/RNA helicase
MSIELQNIFSQIKNELEKLRGDNDSYQYNEHNIDKERHNVLMCNETKDIQAYPGTGKTTLLVDKLSLLLKHWNLKHSGIVVLSHTNVAKNEIIKLSNDYPELGKLLYYPHYIGTIHNFANTFLGLPYIRKKEWKVKAIDDGLADSKGRKIIGYNNYYLKKRNGIYSNRSKRFCFIDSNLSQTILFSELEILDTTETAKTISKCRDRMTEQGYFYYDDLLCFSLKLIEEQNSLILPFRKRFPLVFIDEAQDNSKLQSELLYKLFIEGNNTSIVQRFGDINQKIYNGEELEDWKFPREDNQLEIKLSYRCKSNIAKFASNFTKDREGYFEGKTKEDGSNGHLCFIPFCDDNKNEVLKIFAEKIKELKLDEIEKFSAIAIGANDKNKQLRISSYMPTFTKFVQIGYPKKLEEAYDFAEKEIIETGNFNKAYKILCKFYSTQQDIQQDMTAEEIKQKSKDELKEILINLNSQQNQNHQNKIKSDDKIYKDENGVEIKVNTIHSVKGETHNAVLVLDTKHKKSNELIKLLDDFESTDKKISKEEIPYREIYFVAFSRATDLLCLAIQEKYYDELRQNVLFKNFS